MRQHSVLITVTGYDRPGVTSALFAALAAHDVEVLDVEQVVIRGRLVLGIVLGLHGEPGHLRRAATHAAEALGVDVDVAISDDGTGPDSWRPVRHHVLVLGRPLRAGAVSEVARRIADLGGNIDAITHLTCRPATALQLTVSGADHASLATTLVAAARETGTDVALERAGLLRRPKRLVLIDLETTLVGPDVWSLLAAAAGRAADSGRLLTPTLGDPAAGARAELIRARAALLAGLPVTALDDVRQQLRAAPGLPALIGSLRRMGYRCGAVSGGVAQVTERLVDGLGLDFLAGNTLETADGVLTGTVLGDLVDQPGRARALVRFAEVYGVPVNQCVAVGGSEADVGMLALAGLGVTIRAASGGQPDPDHLLGTRAADLDPLLFVLGLSPESAGEPDPVGLAGIGFWAR